MRPLLHNTTILLTVVAAAMGALSSCSTGIESTKKIRMTKEDVRLMAKSPEQKLAESIHGTPLSTWERGRRFMASSDRTLYIFDPSSVPAHLTGQPMKGREIIFAGLSSQQNPDLREECVILFTIGADTLRYRTGKPTETAMTEIDSSRMPLLADRYLIDRWKEKISGATFWTKSNLWYDARGQRVAGLKFAKVKVLDVEPAVGDFPISVKIEGPSGEEAFLQMNYTSDLHDSRNFAAIFLLSDPKEKHPEITDANWSLIQRGKVGPGMTKEECKLALGNPDEVRSGHNRAQTMDIWQYSDGTYLMFNDGLLTNFRQ